MAAEFSQEEVEEFKEAFDLFDQNGDGLVATRQLGTVMRSLGLDLTKDDIRGVVKEVDVNENGTVDFDEFVEVMKKTPKVDEEDELRQVFNLMDSNHEGYIIVAEMIDRLQNGCGCTLTEAEVEEMKAAFEGPTCNFDEFVRAMKNPAVW